MATDATTTALADLPSTVAQAVIDISTEDETVETDILSRVVKTSFERPGNRVNHRVIDENSSYVAHQATGPATFMRDTGLDILSVEHHYTAAAAKVHALIAYREGLEFDEPVFLTEV